MTTPLPFGQPNRGVLAGTIERVTFHNAESGFCVLPIKARGHLDLVTIGWPRGDHRRRRMDPRPDPPIAAPGGAVDGPTRAGVPALDLELAERTVIADPVGDMRCVFLRGLYRAEQGLIPDLSKREDDSGFYFVETIPTSPCRGSSTW
jgi:hypothetical protein